MDDASPGDLIASLAEAWNQWGPRATYPSCMVKNGWPGQSMKTYENRKKNNWKYPNKIAGWLISWKILLKWMLTRGTPMDWKPYAWGSAWAFIWDSVCHGIRPKWNQRGPCPLVIWDGNGKSETFIEFTLGKNSLFQWPCSIAYCMFTRGYLLQTLLPQLPGYITQKNHWFYGRYIYSYIGLQTN